MIIRDSYPVQNYGRVIKCPRRGMGYEGVDCNELFVAALQNFCTLLPTYLLYQP